MLNVYVFISNRNNNVMKYELSNIMLPQEIKAYFMYIKDIYNIFLYISFILFLYFYFLSYKYIYLFFL